MSTKPIEKLTYGERAAKHGVGIAADLLRLMERKKTNLCVSVDVTTKSEFLRVIDAVGPYCCLIKTHIDIITDFDEDLIKQLVELSKRHDFYIFEDRKFADIGNTVALQYSAGIYKISSWSHIVNAHVVPGEGIITGLGTVGKPLGRGLLLLAEMSSKGTLAKGEYTAEAIAMAERNSDYVMGFIAVHRPAFDSACDFLVMSPGVGLAAKGDALGQQYVTPQECVCERGCDIPIVGRGIYATGDAKEQAQAYREACWRAYEGRLAA